MALIWPLWNGLETAGVRHGLESLVAMTDDDTSAQDDQGIGDRRPITTQEELAAEVRRLLLAHERATSSKVNRKTLAEATIVSLASLYAYLKGTTLPPADAFDRLLIEIGVNGVDRGRLATIRDEIDVQRSTQQSKAAVIPRDLPQDVYGFIGRDDEFAELDQLMAESGKQSSGGVASIVSGTAGVGKTALAVHWGHQTRKNFPDGQLYVDLRGYDPDQPLDPGEALAAMLRRLGVDGDDIPSEPAERAARYRTLLDGRRLLVVLDNAFDGDQVRLLLPGSPTCFVVITSRDRLTGLVARDGVRRIDLDLLPFDDSLALLRLLVGTRVDAEPSAAAQLIDRCARLPLALRIVAEVTAARRDNSLAEIARELADERRRLDILDADGDPRAAVRAVFSWSYSRLDIDAARGFRLLGLHPGADFDLYAVAALAGSDVGQAQRITDKLVHVHLVEQYTDVRFRMHDLLRAYAAERADEATEFDIRPAWTRLLDYYRYAAATAMNTRFPHERERRPQVAVPGTPVPTLSEETAALAWLDAERLNFVALVSSVRRPNWLDTHATDLAAIIWRYLDIGAYANDALTVHKGALDAARRNQDRSAEGAILAFLGGTYTRLGRFSDAIVVLEQSLVIRRELDDRVGEGAVLNILGTVLDSTGQPEKALNYLQQALDITRQIGNEAREAATLNNLGTVLHDLGRSGEALDHFCQALNLAHEKGDETSEGRLLANIGQVHCRLGDYDAALDSLNKALVISQSASDRRSEALALGDLGDVCARLGKLDEACNHHEAALLIGCEIDDRDVEATMRSKLGATYAWLGRTDDALNELEQALAISRDIGEPTVETETHNRLGTVLRSVGDLEQAKGHHDSAHELARRLGNRYQEAHALDASAYVWNMSGNTTEARRKWQQALDIFVELKVPEAAAVQASLTELDNT